MKKVIMSVPLDLEPRKHFSDLRNALIYVNADVVVLPIELSDGQGQIGNSVKIIDNTAICKNLVIAEYLKKHNFEIIEADNLDFYIDRNICIYSVELNKNVQEYCQQNNIITYKIDLLNHSKKLFEVFTVLDSGFIIWKPDEFTEYSRYMIKTFYPNRFITDRLISIISIDNNIISSLKLNTDLTNALYKTHHTIIPVNISLYNEMTNLNNLTLKY